MSGVKTWLATEVGRVAELPCLEDALFGFGASRYAAYRLRYVFVQALLRTLFRIVELGLFVSALPFEVLSSVLVLRSSMLLGEGLWWGALETLRRDVRSLFAQSRLGLASQRIRQWLALAVVLGIVGLGCGGLWLWFGPSPFKSFSVVDAFLLGCCVRFGIDLVVAAYHAGVYGVRRVYRPVWSLALIDFADVAIMGAAFLWLGLWGLAFALVTVGVLRALVVWWFARRVYRALKLDVGAPKAWFRALVRRPAWSLRHSVEHALGNVIAQVDALFVLGLIAAPNESETTLLLAGLFHVVAPLQAVAGVWSRMFYFDFKRLEAWGSRFLLSRFEAFLSRASFWIPLPIGAVTLAVMVAFWRGPAVFLALELTWLAAVRSRLSLLHIRAYSLSDHRFLWRLCLVMSCVAAMVPLVAHLPPEVALGAVVTLMTLGLAVLGRSQLPLTSRTPHGLLEPSVWLRELLRVRQPVQLGLARVDRRLSTVGRLGRAVRLVAREGVTTRLSNDTVAWFSPQASAREALLTHGAGTVRELQLGELAVNGRRALEAGLPGDTWQRHLGSFICQDADDKSLGLEVLTTRIHAIHPECRVLDVKTKATFSEFTTAGSRELRRLLLDATRGDWRFRSLGDKEVAVFAPAGEPTALIVIPKRAGYASDRKGAVSALIARANIAWALR